MFTSNNLNDSDLARLLQEEYDREAAVVLGDEDDDRRETETTDSSLLLSRNDKHKPFIGSRQSSMSGLSPVDPSLELSDPTPDIYLLYLDFNVRYFWGSLAGIEVKWSPRMTLCAGLCVYEGRGGLCSVRLSLPLLKLRPRKDLVETLLHEMIHAYLFVTDNDRDHSGHGPNFLSHMHRLNKATGANISVYHTFNDEVDSYQQHWWRCSGPCQKRAPYFGYVKRAMNRVPSAKDFWWPEHQATCGGVYTKIKEPEGYRQKTSGKGKEGNPLDPSKDIRAFWGKGHTLSSTTEVNNKAGGTSQSEGKPRTNSMNVPTFSGGLGPSNTMTGQPSINGALSKPSYDYKNISTITKSASDPSASGRNETSPSLCFKQPTNSHKDTYSTSVNVTNSKIKTPANSNSTFSDTRKDLSRDGLSQPTKRKTSADSNYASPGPRVGNTNSVSGVHKIFDKNSFSSNKKQKNSPHVNSKQVSFPKNFVSVCVGGDSSGPAVSLKKKKKKYVIDELDSNDGLWDETVDLTADVNFSELSNESNSIGKPNNPGSVNSLDKMSAVVNRAHAGLTDHRSDITSFMKKDSPKSKPFQASVQSSDKTNKKTNEISNGNWAVKNKTGDLSLHEGTRPGLGDLGSRPSISESGASMFTGQGYKLGTGESGTSFLSQMRKNWQQRSGSTASTSSREPSHGTPDNRLSRLSHIDQVSDSSSLPNKKRKSVEAFSAQEVDNLGSSKTVKIDKNWSGETDKEKKSLGAPTSDISRYSDSNIRHTSVSQPFNEANNIDAPYTHAQVPCPVCNVFVSENAINAHLDLCLL